MRQEIVDYIIIAARALPAGLLAAAVAAALILATGDADVWGWVPVLVYWVAYLHHAERHWGNTSGRRTGNGQTCRGQNSDRAIADDGQAA